jgi:5S rRNA maturation endonuclease (ribonuclease M5)
MAEYYGFKDASEVKANPVVDWGTIAMKVGQDLDKNKENRQRLRAEDQKITSENLDTLSKADLGADQSINKQLTDAVYENKKLQGEWFNQLKNGKMTRQEYASRSQALKNNWGILNNVVKNRAANDKVLMDAIQSNTEDALTSTIAKKLGTLSNLQNKKLYTDPTTGVMVVADYDENGKIIESSMMDINSINNAQVDAAPRVNVVEGVKPIAATAAKLITDNGIRSLEDAMRSPAYPQMRKAAQDSVLSSNRRIADVLVNSSGMGYFITDDPSEAEKNPLAILATSTGGNFDVVLDPVKDAKKIEAANNVVGKALDLQMPFIEKVTLPTPRQPRAAAAPKEDKDPPPTISQVNPIRVGNKQGAVAIINDPVGIKTNSGFVEKVVNTGIDEDGRHFVKVVRYNSKENLGVEGGSTSFSASQTTPKTYVYYGEQITPRLKGDKKNIREYSPTNYANFRSRAGFGSDEELRVFLEDQRGVRLPTYKASAGKKTNDKTSKSDPLGLGL